MLKRKRCEANILDVIEELEEVMPRCVALITAGMLWEEDVDWIGSCSDAELATGLIADRSPHDPLCMSLSKLVHYEFHSLAHRDWFSMNRGMALFCVQCVEWYIANALGCSFFTRSNEAASAVLAELHRRNWPMVPDPSDVDQCTDLALLEELKSRCPPRQIYANNPSVEFFQVFGAHMDLVKIDKTLGERFRQNPAAVKCIVDRYDWGDKFVDLFSNAELERHFGIGWALHKNMVRRRSKEVMSYFERDRSQLGEHNACYLRWAMPLLFECDPKKASRSEIEFMLHNTELLDQREAQELFVVVHRARVPQSLVDKCSVEFLMQLEPKYVFDAHFLQQLAIRGVPLHLMQDRHTLALITAMGVHLEAALEVGEQTVSHAKCRGTIKQHC